MTVSQSSVTFFLALLALLAHFSGTFRDYAVAIRDWATGTNFAMVAGLVDIDRSNLTAILSSRRNFSVGVSDATCFIHLPVNRTEFLLAEQTQRDAVWNNTEKPPSPELSWIGPILVAYDLETPAFLPPYGVEMVTFTHTFTGFPSTKITRSADQPVSFCSFGGVDQANEMAATGQTVEVAVLRNFDALEILQETSDLEKDSGDERRRLSLISEIEALNK